MKHLGLFEGIGGFSLAARWMGWETVAWCEWNEFCQKVLKYHFPEAEGHGDIMKTDFTKYANTIDVLTGGFPCQPYSQAGKRLGKDDDRHLWPEMLRAIREIQPRYVVGENVRGLTNWNGGMVFDEVQADLENEGYEVLPFLLPACGVNAPHRRDRIWFVAHRIGEEQRESTKRRVRAEFRDGTRSSTNARLQRQKRSEQQPMGIKQLRKGGVTADTEGLRINRTPEHENNSGQSGERGRCDIDNTSEISKRDSSTNSPNIRHEQSGSTRNGRSGFKDGDSDADATNTESVKQWNERSSQGQSKQQIGGCDFKPSWQEFPTQPPVCGRDDGISSRLAGITISKHRNESIKGYGNAIVPQVAYEIFKSIQYSNDQPHRNK